MKNKILSLAFVTLLFAACNNEEPIAVNNSDAIHFRTSMTRASELDLKGLKQQGFNVTALWGKQTYFDGVGYSYDETNDVWFGNGVHFWPKGDNVSVRFFAYSPGSLSDKVSISDGSKTMTGFSPNSSIATQIDFVSAYNAGNKKDYEGKDITLTFKHRLSQIKVQAKRNVKDYYKFEIIGVRIGNVGGTADFVFVEDPDENVRTGQWGDPYAVASYDADSKILNKEGNKVPVEVGTTATSLMGLEGPAMLIPQTCSAWDPKTPGNKGAYIAVLLRITHKEPNADEVVIYPFGNMKDSEGATKKYAWAAVPVEVDWEPNKKYIYTLVFDYGAGYVDPTEPNPDNDGGEDPDPDPDPKPAEPILRAITFKVDITDWTKEPENKEYDMTDPVADEGGAGEAEETEEENTDEE